MSTSNSDSIYDRVVQHIFFSGHVTPGSKVVEKKLADHLGVSRIPIRETLRQLSGQGLLVSDHNGQGARLRNYTAEDIRQLYELRELLEGGAAKAAARAATDTDVARMEMICSQTAAEVGDYGSKKWADLDHAFHDALADASHNDRIATGIEAVAHGVPLRILLVSVPLRATQADSRRGKSSYASRTRRPSNTAAADLRRRCRRRRERKARDDMRVSIDRFTQDLLARDLAERM